MSNAPAWLRCENCLWWISGMDAGETGCNYDRIDVIGKNPFSRCDNWTCKRCFRSWDQWEGEEINHLYCKVLARKNHKKGEQ